jgi:hypothetical protein
MTGFRQAVTVINTWYTVLNITNSGYVNILGFMANVKKIGVLHLKVTIDGDTPNDIDFGGTGSPLICFNNDVSGDSEINARLNLDARFDTSLKVEIMDDEGGNDIRCNVVYLIDH